MSDFEAVVAGSGFAGAVTTARLAQAGVNVCLLERGRRYERDDFPTFPLEARREQSGDDRLEYEPPRDFSRWLWSIDQGLWDARDLGGVTSIQAAGYGGGSLVYASVHLRAPESVFEARAETGRRLWPASYSKAALEPYYDLVAFTLDVQPFPYERNPLAKASRLLEAAERNDGKSNWFTPPLAVTFAGPLRNRWGREQGQCDLRGYCCFGCGSGAKSTLNLNYLAIAEDPSGAGEYDEETTRELENARPATIRTLAEVEEISRRENGEFAVQYEDHLLHIRRTITADNVFLCAGAVNTTALLFENRARLFPKERPELAKALGSRYHPNGDALAVVFDCERLQQAGHGPTITSSLLYTLPDEAAGAPVWFLVQDGGVPEELDVLLGVFRSPLWLRRNRYRERKAGGEAASARTFVRPEEPAWGRNLPRVHLRQYHRQRAAGARELVAMLPPHASERIQVGEGARPPKGEGPDPWPEWLKEAAQLNRTQLLDMLGIAAEPLVRNALDYLAYHLENRFDDLVGDLANTVPRGRDLIESARKLALSRGLLRLGAQLLWGSEPDAVKHVLGALLQLPRDVDDVTERLVSLLRWCADYRPGDGRTAVLLTMGIDPHPGTLSLDENGRLRADLMEARQARLRSSQERVLRAIAKDWGGELRTDPTWTFARRRLTVHSQGGCPMSDSEADGVLDENGEVRGCPGLFVMDAAAFPTSVGVNPAATIAAIAERKVEAFIRRRQPDWSAPRHVELEDWRKRNRHLLDPLANGTVAAGSKVACGIVGIRFTEKLTGHFSKCQLAPWERPLSEIAKHDERTWPTDAQMFDTTIERVERAERDGIRARPQPTPTGHGFPERGEIELRLRCRIDDLTDFLERHHANEAPSLRVDGELEVQWRKEKGGVHPFETKQIAVSGMAQLFRPAGDRRKKTFFYVLRFSLDEVPYVLRGYKFVRDDSRLDVWQDTSTLYFDIARAENAEHPVREGVLRVPPAVFLREQIKSMEVTGTDDGDRRAWALAAFATYFFGHLAEAYVPELETLPAVLRNMLTRTHG